MEGEVHPRLHAAGRQLPGSGTRLRPDVRGPQHLRPHLPDLTRQRNQQRRRCILSHPSTYITSSDPRIFGDKEVVIRDQSTGVDYTPKDYRALLDDAGLSWVKPIANFYIGGVPFADRAHFPNVDVYAEKGSGLETLVGLGLADLTVGQLVTPSTELFTRDGDINQEDLTNDAVAVWARMDCYHFSLTDNPGVNHFELPDDADVLARLVANAATPPSDCD